jgi:hypothetical protein
MHALQDGAMSRHYWFCKGPMSTMCWTLLGVKIFQEFAGFWAAFEQGFLLQSCWTRPVTLTNW